MMKTCALTAFVFVTLPLAVSSCASIDDGAKEIWTSEDEAAYQQCLLDSMAVATAWEMIEQSCRERVEGDETRFYRD